MQLTSDQVAGTRTVSLRRPASNQRNVDSSKRLLEPIVPKQQDLALMQRLASMNFVDKDWSSGCVWGFLFGWIAAVLWTAPAVFAAATRSPSHIGHATPVWPVSHASAWMAAWGAFCGTFWMLQWFISIPYCFIASIVSAGMAFVAGRQVASQWEKNLTTSVTWSMVGSCSLVVLLTVILVMSSNSQTPAVQNQAR